MDNNSYSVKENAGKSLRAFLLTLSVSLIVFSAVYYVLTSNASKSESFDSSITEKTDTSANVDTGSATGDVAGDENEKTVFGSIAEKDPGVQSGVVLSGATGETPQTTTTTGTTPDTGTFSLTVGLFTALVFFLASMVMVSKNPRKIALNEFEKSATKKVDKE